MEKSEIFQTIKLRWKDSERFSEDIWIILTKLGYQKHSEIKLPDGIWQVFCTEKIPELKIQSIERQKIMLFFAIWNQAHTEKKFIVSGMCESIENLKGPLKFVSSIISHSSDRIRKRFFRTAEMLSVENAQDYGYIRGLTIGIILMLIDILPWHIGRFRPQGIMSTFLDYTRIVYYGTPGFAILVGMAAIGIYFTVLFILFPITVGNLYLMKARRIERNIIESLPEVLFDWEYGKDAEASLYEQIRTATENIKREETYRQIVSRWKSINRADFYELYEIFREGLISARALYGILQKITKTCPDFDFNEYLRIMSDVNEKTTEVVLKISDKQENQDVNLLE